MMLDRLRTATSHLLGRPAVGRAVNRLFEDQIPSRGVIAFTRSPGVDDATRARIFLGLHEADARAAITRHLRGDADVVVLGAGIGLCAAVIARRLATGRQLACVASDDDTEPLIAQNVAINAPDAQLTVLPHGTSLASARAAAGFSDTFALVAADAAAVHDAAEDSDGMQRCVQVLAPADDDAIAALSRFELVPRARSGQVIVFERRSRT